MHNFNDVALLITVYNRSASLERLLKAFKELEITFGEIIVSDDASKKKHFDKMMEMKQIYGFKLITTKENRGLGNNINKGQLAVTKPFTLYVQEDFVPKQEFLPVFSNAINIMKTEPTMDSVRFYAYFPYPYTRPYNNNFDEMIFEAGFLKWNHLKFYMYSDHPHLRRSIFFDKFGRYDEGIKPDLTEFNMALSFIKNRGRGLLAKNIYNIFDQKNSADEPSTINRSSWREKESLAVKSMRKLFLVYRYIKNTIQLARK